MKVVVDTNVVVSHYLTPAAVAARVLHAWRAQRFELVTSEAILQEVARVLAYPHLRARHQMDEPEIAQVIENFRDLALLVEPPASPTVITDDPSDNIFLACAVAGGAAVIVSGDRHLLTLGQYEGIPILRPAAFLALLEQQAAGGDA
jgi:putative PIN family toxin of toxin-antitoxin system